MSVVRKKLEQQIRQRAWENRKGLYVPRVEGDTKRADWPVCMTCRQDVEAVNIEDLHKDTVVIRARCHGKEFTVKLDFPFEIMKRTDKETWQHIRTAMNNVTFFDPSIA